MKPQHGRQQQEPPRQVKPAATAIERRPAASLAEIPDYLRRTDGGIPAGLENLDRQDMTLPRLGLCQALTPQRSKSDPKFIPGLTEGEFFNTITREIYGTRVELVPLLFYKTRILFGPMDEGTACAQFFNYAALVVGKNGGVSPEGLLVTSFKSSSLKVAKDWNAFIRIRNLDIFSGVYEFTAVERKNDVGRWYEPVVNPAGNVTRETYAAAKQAYAAVADLQRQGRLRHDVSDLSPEGGEGVAPF